MGLFPYLSMLGGGGEVGEPVYVKPIYLVYYDPKRTKQQEEYARIQRAKGGAIGMAGWANQGQVNLDNKIIKSGAKTAWTLRGYMNQQKGHTSMNPTMFDGTQDWTPQRSSQSFLNHMVGFGYSGWNAHGAGNNPQFNRWDSVPLGLHSKAFIDKYNGKTIDAPYLRPAMGGWQNTLTQSTGSKSSGGASMRFGVEAYSTLETRRYGGGITPFQALAKHSREAKLAPGLKKMFKDDTKPKGFVRKSTKPV